MTDWKLKIEAFLANPPERVLLADDDLAGRRQTHLGELVGSPKLPQAAQQANRMAFGLDAPPFLREIGNPFREEPVLTHPLSGESLCIEALRLKPGDVSEAVESIRANYLSSPSPSDQDYRRAFLALWRLLPEKLGEKDPLWNVLPAHPCVPDQSVWDHASMASALAAAGGKPAFFILNIASAQRFVTRARRTQDLWMGSFLLSSLAWEGMRVVAERCGPDCIIAPRLRGQPWVDRWLRGEMEIGGVPEPSPEELQIGNFPNIFTAVVSSEDERLIHDVEEAVQDRWKEIGEEVKGYVEKAIGTDDGLEEKVERVLEERGIRRVSAEGLTKRMRGLAGGAVWGTLWKSQLDDFLESEIFWTVLPWYPEEDRPDEIVEHCRDLLGEGAVESFDELWEEIEPHMEPSDLNRGMVYGLLSRLAGRTLETRKNLRGFNQVEEPDEKCSLCGVRTALHPWINEDGYYPEFRTFWDVVARIEGEDEDGEKRKLVGRIRRGDRLCGVCLTKRLAWEAYFTEELGLDPETSHVLFPSTSSISTAGFKADVLRTLAEKREGVSREKTKDLYKAIEGYVQVVRDLLRPPGILLRSADIPKLVEEKGVALQVDEFDPDVLKRFLWLDGEWLYEGSFDVDAIAWEYRVPEREIDGDQVERAREAMEGLLHAAAECGIRPPARYYALVAMDGDHMGDWLSGKEAPTLEEVVHPRCRDLVAGNIPGGARRPLGSAAHSAFATAGWNFALQGVREVVEKEYHGKLIYAGGDDVLAFVPLDDLLNVLEELNRIFPGEKNGFMERGDRLYLMMGGKATISAGFVIAHYTHPFSAVAEDAHAGALEQSAKEGLGRDAFSAHLLKRSGRRVEAGAKWQSGESGVETLEVLRGIIERLKTEGEGSLSDRFIYQLSEEGALAGLPLEAQRSEISRLVGRHLEIEDRKRREEVTDKVGGGLGDLLQGLREEEIARLILEHLEVDGAAEEKRRKALEAAGYVVKELERSRPGSEMEREMLSELLTDVDRLGRQDEDDEDALKDFYRAFTCHADFDRFLGLLHLARFVAKGGR